MTPPTDAERFPRDLAGWVTRLQTAELPVLGATAEAIEALRAHEDEVDAHLLAESLGQDPLMSLKLLAHVGAQRSRRGIDEARAGQAETVTEALVLLGIGPFFRAFGPQPAVESRLASHAGALAGFGAVLARAHRAAAFALAFAVHRMDHDAPVIHLAALLHDFAEMLLWVEAPALAARIHERQQADPTLRSCAVQRELLGTTLHELQTALLRAWRLPELLVRLGDERHADGPQVRNVVLAARVARHSSRGWDDAALPDDVRDVAALLNLGETPASRLLREVDRSG